MRVDKYQKFFKIDMLTTLKEEYNTILCYSSRLLNISIKNKDGILDKILIFCAICPMLKLNHEPIRKYMYDYFLSSKNNKLHVIRIW